jgi:hypothetical protein
LLSYPVRCGKDDSVVIDIKKTSYKKVSTFLDYCQNRLGLIKYREENGIASITSIQRLHEIFKDYKVDNAETYKALVKEREQAARPVSTSASGNDIFTNLASSNSSSSTGHSGGKGGSSSTKIQVYELYKLPKKLREVFGSIHGEYGEHLKISEAKDIIVMYMKRNQLEASPATAALAVNDEGAPVTDKKQPASNLLIIPPPDLLYDICREFSDKKKSQATASKDQAKAEEAKPATASHVKATVDAEFEEYGTLPSSTSSGMADWDLAMPSAPAIQMKVKAGGLINIDNMTPAEVAALQTSGQTGVPGAARGTSRITGGSSVGGWGVDAGKVWKPISLPPAPPAAKSTGPVKGGGAGDSGTKKSFASATSANLPAKRQDPSAAAEIHPVPSGGPVELTKEEFLKLIISKMTLYHGIVQPDGKLLPPLL